MGPRRSGILDTFLTRQENGMADDVTVATVQGQFDEEQMRAFLEAHGIPTRVRGETLRTTHGIVIDGLGAVDVLVPRDRAEDARDLLTRVDRGEFILAADDRSGA